MYEEFLGIICHSLLYFAILTYIMNYSVLHPLVKNIKIHICCLNNVWFDCVFCVRSVCT